MNPSKLFITSLLAAAAMGTSAYATSLSDATLAIESFTTENITALGTAGWTVSDITISGTDGTFTTTGTQPSITAANGSSNTLSTAVSERYTFSTIVTVDASLFSGTGNGNIIAGSTISGENVSTTSDIGVGFSSGNITGVYSNVVWNDGRNRTLDVSNSIVNGKVTIGLVFTGGSGVNIYLADGSTANIAGLMTKTNYNAISLSDSTSVTYSNLYWFNTALSGADMQAAVVSATSTGTRQAALTWAGGTSGTWDYESDTNWTMPGESGTVSTAFQDWDGVTFATEGAQVELTQSVGSYWLKDLTVSSATSLTGTGSVRVDAANLTTTAALTLDENVVLDLGYISAATTVNNVVGTGTVKVVSTSTGYGATLTLDADFTGTIDYSGKFNTSNGMTNATAKFALSNGSMWGSNTITNDIHFQTNYQIGDSSATTITLNGNLTQADGTTLTIGTNVGTNITFGGRANLYHLTQSTGTLTIGGATTVTGNYQGSSGTSTHSVLTVNAGGSLSVGGDLTLRFENNINNNTHIGATMNVSGEVSVGGNFWIARDGKGIVHIKDGGTVVANTLTFGQRWADSEGTSKTSQVNVASGGKLIAGSIVANTDRNVNQQGVKDVDILKSSELNLNGGTLGTSADSMTIDVASGNTALSITLGAGTTSTINTGKYDTATKTFTGTGAAISIANVISGDGALKKTGAGTLTLSGNNTFTGGIEIAKGVVEATNAAALGVAANAVRISGGQLSIGSSTTAGVALNQTAITVVLGNAYKTTTALVGENGGALATGTTVTVDATDLNALGLVAGVANEYSIWNESLETSGVTLELSGAFRTLLADAGWTSSISGGTLTISAIPEPSVFGLLAGLGGLALAGTRRRRRK